MCLFSVAGLAAQETQAAETPPFVIRSLDFSVEGRTRVAALKQRLEAEGPVVGRSFPDRASLDAFVADRRQALLNNRVLASAEPRLTVSPAEGGGSDVALGFDIVDTQNLVVLPEPKYDSNTGLTLYLKGRDYDFLGSMQTLDLDLSYVSEAANDRYFEAETDFFLPFRAFGADWSLGFMEDAALWTQGGVGKSSSAASLTYNIPGLGIPARVKAIGGLFYNGDLPETSYLNEAPFYAPLYEPDPWYLSGILSASAALPLGFGLGSLGPLSFTPELRLTANWWPNTELAYPWRQGAAPSGAASLGAGRIDWEGNFQRGSAVSVGALATYYATQGETVADLELKLEGHWAWAGRLGVSARLIALDRLLGSPDMVDLCGYLGMDSLGQYLRGVIDDQARGVAGAFVNLSVPVKLFDFPTHAIIGKDWLDFELQAAPFVDAALIEPDRGASFGSDWLWYTGGLEFLVFPKIFRSLVVRASIGWDLVSPAHPYEIYIGTQLMTDPIQSTYITWVEN